MLIKRVYNNNVAMVVDDRDEECIAIGRGMAFGLRPGDTVDASKVERVFHPRKRRHPRPHRTAYSHHSRRVFRHRRGHCEHAPPRVQPRGGRCPAHRAHRPHLAFTRARSARASLRQPAPYGHQAVYKREFELAGRAAQIIEEHTSIRISEAERGFITLHIVNASMASAPTSSYVPSASFRTCWTSLHRSSRSPTTRAPSNMKRFLRPPAVFCHPRSRRERGAIGRHLSLSLG